MSTAIKDKALGIFWNEDKILVSEYHNPITNEPFYRPPGGRIDYGEPSSAALIREMDEELNAEITNLNFLGVIENIYEYKDKLSHENLFLYQADFTESKMYATDDLEAFEYTDDRKFVMKWIHIDEFLSDRAKLLPQELKFLLQKEIIAVSASI
ncbi:MAG: NUDIX hydrolase [Promethearchaeota archaeon]